LRKGISHTRELQQQCGASAMTAKTRVAVVAAIAIHFTSAIAVAQTTETTTRNDSYLIAYFLDAEPGDISRAALPTTARDVVVARWKAALSVRREPDEHALVPEYLFRSKLSVAVVLSGHAAAGDNFDATFAKPNASGRMTMIPHSPDEVNREYFVIAYVAEDGQRHLAGYPISEAKYRAWEAAVMESVRLPGVPKH
jgi:hypothetical protein